MSDGTGLLLRPFGGETRSFRLDIDRVRALQAKTDCGPLELMRRVEVGSWRIDDLRETLFQGLQGGGMSMMAATLLIQTGFDKAPAGYAQFATLTHEVLAAVLFGPEDDPVGESPAGAARKSRSRAKKSASAA